MELYNLSGHRSGGVCVNCRHNTAGRNCHNCKEGFYRDPSRPITHRKACKGRLRFLPSSLFFFWLAACNCNLHARRCRFNKELYLLSRRTSGGVCLKCRHNTAGRFCHYCKESYYRDYSKPITHRKACKGRLQNKCNDLLLCSSCTLLPWCNTSVPSVDNVTLLIYIYIDRPISVFFTFLSVYLVFLLSFCPIAALLGGICCCFVLPFFLLLVNRIDSVLGKKKCFNCCSQRKAWNYKSLMDQSTRTETKLNIRLTSRTTTKCRHQAFCDVIRLIINDYFTRAHKRAHKRTHKRTQTI